MNPSIFKAYDVRATYPDNLNEDAAWRVGCAIGRYFTDLPQPDGVRLPRTVLVSRDMRPSSPSLSQALIEGLRAAEMDVINLGMCDTSFQYFAVNHLGAVAGVQCTASHNPINYNGFKIAGPQAKPVGADTGLDVIKGIALELGERGSLPAKGKVEERDLWKEYRDHVLRFLPPLKRKLKVFVDASNGMGGVMVPKVFDGVKNLEIIQLNFEIGGDFAHEPNPLVAENMIPTQEGVREHQAHLGACFDGDADRCMLTDERGNILGCDHLTALLAGHFLEQEAGATVVYDLRSSKAVEEAVRQAGGVPRRGRVGHVFMKEALRESDAIFGGELSGHFYFRDNYYADSGAITLAIVLGLLGNGDQPLSERIKPYQKYPQSGEINFEVEDKVGVMAALEDRYGEMAGVDRLDGVTIDAWEGEGWWFNVRPSNTEPLLRLNAEAQDKAKLAALLDELKPQLGKEVQH